MKQLVRNWVLFPKQFRASAVLGVLGDSVSMPEIYPGEDPECAPGYFLIF